MPLKRMPNGEYINVPDNITPQGLAKLEAQFKATRATRGDTPRTQIRAQNTPSVQEQAMAERQRIKKKREGNALSRFADSFNNTVNPLNWVGGLGEAGVLANFDDELQGVGRGLRSFVEGKGFSSGYDVGREMRNQEKYEARRDNPVSGTVAEIAGSLLNPVGTGAGALKTGGAIASRVAPRAGNVLSRAGRAVDGAGAITKGVLTGVNTGALNAAGSSEDLNDLPGGVAFGAALGGGLGGGLGLLGRAGQGAYRIMRDRSPAASKRVAAQEVQKMLERGEITPETANKMIQKANREGGDMMLMDVNPNLTSTAGALSRNTNIRSSNKLVSRGESRADARRSRIASKIEETAELPAGVKDFNALREGDELLAGRKGASGRDYADNGVMDAKFDWSDNLEDAVTSAPNFERLMNNAFSRAQQFGDDLGVMGVNDGVKKVIPSMRVWNYLKREYDSVIKQAYRAGDETTGAAYSAELGRIKSAIMEANPQYADVLKVQQDFFQKQKALEFGQSIWKKLATEPRQTRRALDSLKAQSPDQFNMARVGVIDDLINRVLTADNPLRVITRVKQDTEARQVLEMMFGNKQRYNQFMRFLRKEADGARADAMTRYGGQSQTSRIQQAGNSLDNDLAELGVGAASGAAFGGIMGAPANVARRLIQMSKGVSNDAQDEIAKMLMSKGGDDFLAAMRNAVAFTKKQRQNSDMLTTTAAKAGQQTFTTAIGGE